MVIVGITDIHGDVRALDRMHADLAAADLVIACGDLTSFGDRKEAERVVEAIRTRCKRLFAVPGNCDTPKAAQYLEDAGVALHERSCIVEGIAFVGIGGSLPCMGRTPTEYTEVQLADFLTRVAENVPPDAPMVLVSHEPPFDTPVDNANYGGHVGSVSVRSFIESRSPLLCLCGHIHESQGADAIGTTRIVNPGPLRDGHYVYAELSDKLDLIEIRSC